MLDLAGGPRARLGSGCVLSLGAGLGKPHPEGLAVCAGHQQKQHWQLEEEEKQPQPGLGEEKAAQAGGGGWVPGSRLWKDTVQQEPLGLSQGGLGHGARSGKDKDSTVGGPPPLPQGPSSPMSPLQQQQQRWGRGYQTPELLPPSAELLRVLHLLWLSLPAPLSLPGDGGRGREGPRGSQRPLP